MISNLKLKKLTEDDFQNYFTLVSDKKVMEMITGTPLKREEAQRKFEKLIANNKLDKNFGSYQIKCDETDVFLGFAKLEIEFKGATKAELGYMILPEYWGKGIAGKIGRELVENAKKLKSLESLYAIIDPKNAASRKILIHNGFKSKAFKDFDGLQGEILELKLIALEK